MPEPGQQFVEVRHDRVRLYALFQVAAAGGAVHPHAAQPGTLGALHVQDQIVAHVHRFLRGHAERGAGGMEDRRVRLGAAELRGRHRSLEMVGQADGLQIGIAVGDRAEQHPALQAQQARQHVVVGRHGVAGREELDHRQFHLGRVFSRLLERGEQPGAAQGAQVELEFGAAGQQFQARLAQAVDGEALDHARGVAGQPGEQGLFGLQDHGSDRPQGVVQVEQDGARPGPARRRRGGLRVGIQIRRQFGLQGGIGAKRG